MARQSISWRFFELLAPGIILFTVLVMGVKTDDNAGQLARIVNELQSQVMALQEARNQDQATIKTLQEKLHEHFGVSTSTTSDYDSTQELFPEASSTSPFQLMSNTNNGQDGDISVTSPVITRSPETDRVIARVLLSRVDPNDPALKRSTNQLTSGIGNKQTSFEDKLELESRALRMLERESHSLIRLDTQLRELKADLSEVVRVKEREVTVTEEIAEFRLEADSLRDELLRVRREVEEVRVKREEDVMTARQAKAGQMTTKWLQKTVEDIRHEMGELASSVNVSVALGQRQNTEASLALTRSDLSDLRKRLDAVHVSQERDSAWVSQLRQDLGELRTNLQEMATRHQKLAHEVASVKEEVIERASSSPIEKNKHSLSDDRIYDYALGEKNEKHPSKRNTDGNNHHMRHHGHWKVEIEDLQKSVSNMEQHQDRLLNEVRNLKQNQSDLNFRLDTVQTSSTKLENRTAHLGVEQRALNIHMEVIQQQMDQTDRQTQDIRTTVNNITESGIKKLHASTVQLFETLETLENNYDHTIADIRKEMSKMEFNLAQAQSNIGELREEQTDQDQILKSMKNDVKRVQMEAKKDHLRLLAVQSEVINRTLQDTKSYNGEAVSELKMSALESRIVSLAKTVDGERMEVDVLHKQMEEKADVSNLSRWERTQDRLREVVLNITGIVPKMKEEEEKLEKEVEKFVHQLPKDCSMVSNTKQSQNYKSGMYLIQSPSTTSPSHAKAVRVYCDMDTSGGQWTLLQRRLDGRQNFNQNWHQYKEGFGDADGDFWLGNELIHRLTTNDDYVLRIDFWDAAGRYKYAEYDTFRVLQESDGYRLAVAGYHGNASDALGYHNGMAFSTPDKDNDASPTTHCGQFYGSGWWYNHCQYVNINGRYSTGVTWYDIDGQEWSELTRVEMKIKPIRLTTNKSNSLSESIKKF